MARMKRLYAPYTKVNGKWVRATWPASDMGLVPEHPRKAYPKETAVRIYQDWLLAPFLNGVDEIRELRPVKE